MAPLSYPVLLDGMVRIAREQLPVAKHDLVDAYEAGRRFTVPKTLQPFFDAAISQARLDALAADPERELFERLQAKFAPLFIGEKR